MLYKIIEKKQQRLNPELLDEIEGEEAENYQCSSSSSEEEEMEESSMNSHDEEKYE